MPLSQTDWDFLQTQLVTYTDEEQLALYRQVRIEIVNAARTEHGTVEITIRQRTHQVVEPQKLLEYLDGQIAELEEKILRKRAGPSRNYARLGKYP